jgi:hypothetical protein
MWLGEAADRRRIGEPPSAARERGCPPWVVLGVKAMERVASAWRDAPVRITWRGPRPHCPATRTSLTSGDARRVYPAATLTTSHAGRRCPLG